jgi:hypothetical protein
MVKGAQEKRVKTRVVDRRRQMVKEGELTATGRLRREKTQSLRDIRRDVRRERLTPEIVAWLDSQRPRSRKDCREGLRPCPHVSCRFHLYLDVNPETGSIKYNFPGKEVWELEHTCALDIAERGGITLEEVGEVLNLTRERIRQLEASGMKKMSESDALRANAPWEDE